MLRLLVAVLLLANLGLWAWSTGALQALGLAPQQERDPARVGQQVRADAVQVLAPAAAAAALRAVGAASATASPGGVAGLCLEAGPFAPAAVEAAERALAAAALPAGTWVRVNQELGAQFAVVLGPLVGSDAAQKKSEELGRLRLTFELLELPATDTDSGTSTQPGFALGRYDSRGAADAALAGFSQRGVRTARVTVLRPATSVTRLRVDPAMPAIAGQLRSLGGTALGAGFMPCAATSATR